MCTFKTHRECGTDDSVYGGGIPPTSFRAIQKRGRSFGCSNEHLNKDVVKKSVGIQCVTDGSGEVWDRRGKVTLRGKETSRWEGGAGGGLGGEVAGRADG